GFTLVTDPAAGALATRLADRIGSYTDARTVVREASPIVCQPVDGWTAEPLLLSSPSAETYRVVLERRIAELCARVAGAGQVSVVVTLEGGYESVYACDRKVTSAGETVTYIKIGRGEEERLVYLGERAPGIVGVGVVCSGGKDATVCREITSLISAAFGVPINKIYVAGGP
ncbi:MAG: hypothetical protein IIX90_00995, partial [Clostridia bacterium]|nr:hypothetical protein [Clostridia bacterium]